MVAVLMGAAVQLDDFEIHCVGTPFEIGSGDTASGYEELYIDYRNAVGGYRTDEGGGAVWDLLRL